MNTTSYLSDIFEGDFPVSQGFGDDPQYYIQFGLAGHEGVDFATPVGTTALAPFDGIVLREGIDIPGYHNYGLVTVVWDPVQKCAVWFGHLSEEYVSVGEKVKKGWAIGRTGNTGNTSGPHLHLGFVKTDAYGNRLNVNNGYLGFLDALNPLIVTWKLGSGTPPPNADEYVKRAEEAARSLFNAVEAGSHVNDHQYKSKLIDAGVKKYAQDTLTYIG